LTAREIEGRRSAQTRAREVAAGGGGGYARSSKRRAKEATEAFNALRQALYRSASSALDMAIGAVGKGTVAAKNFQKLRSDIQRATTPEELEAVTVEIPEGVAKRP
jgi:transcriptional regulator CtsR